MISFSNFPVRRCGEAGGSDAFFVSSGFFECEPAVYMPFFIGRRTSEKLDMRICLLVYLIVNIVMNPYFRSTTPKQWDRMHFSPLASPPHPVQSQPIMARDNLLLSYISFLSNKFVYLAEEKRSCRSVPWKREKLAMQGYARGLRWNALVTLKLENPG